MTMEPTEVIKGFRDFFEKYDTDILELARKGLNHITLSFFDIAGFNPQLSEELLERPEETFKAMEIGIESFRDSKDKMYFFIKDLPKSNEVMIRELRAKHLEKFWQVVGIIKRKTDVRPKITSARFECPSCGNTLTVLQMDKKFKEPNTCGCGRKGKFTKLSQELVDAYGLVIEELTEYIKAGSELKKINALVKGVLANPEFEQRIFPGVKVKITGILKPFLQENKAGGKKPELDIFFEVNMIEILDSDYDDIVLTEEDKNKFMDLIRTDNKNNKINILAILSDTMFSDVEGYEEVKHGLILQMVGGEQKILPSGYKARGDIHCLMIGNPGSAKSTFCKLVYSFAPKARYASGKGASGTGLTAAVVKDEMMGGWALEAGMMPLAHHGIAICDEFDKLAEEETDAIHEVLEEQQVSISKASIQATLKAETTLLAAANPKFGRFEDYNSIYSQIKLPPALVTRFDLIFLFKDKPDEARDREVGKKILKRYREMGTSEMSKAEIKKFFAFTKQFHPIMNSKMEDIIVDFYVNIRNSTSKNGESGSMPISPRYIEVIRRLSEAHARLNLRNNIITEDVHVAIELVMYYLNQLAINPDTGKLDVDMLEVGVSSTGRSKRLNFIQAINDLSKNHAEFTHEELQAEGEKSGLKSSEIDEMIIKAIRSGELYEPRPGRYQKLM
jgi:replicative DNA helicase Mcm